MDNTSIKENIRKVRKSRKYTQEDMADKLEISLTAYRDLEKGSTNIINANVIRVAELLDISTEELFLGYLPVQSPGKQVEDVRAEYGGQISIMERRVLDLEKLVSSLEDNIRNKDEIISMLKKKLAEVE